MALPPIDMSADLQDTPDKNADDGSDDSPLDDGQSSDVDPVFAADVSEAFPDMDDAQIAALQRAVLGLIGGGGSPPPAPADSSMGF